MGYGVLNWNIIFECIPELKTAVYFKQRFLIFTGLLKYKILKQLKVKGRQGL